ncbi:XRE family transcriptional regulator [Streptomyces noboritoensis]|uniref:XRE family transcriptional regulator n=1 Tax=Streptomyces noboritoensis TaxID=67337 RepID=A0ABV6TDT0_9ACTN
MESRKVGGGNVGKKNPALTDLIRRAADARGWGASHLARAVGVAESGDPARVNRANARRWLTGERAPEYWWPYIAQVLNLDPTNIPSATEHADAPAPDDAGALSPLAALATLSAPELPCEIRPGDIEEVQQAALTLTSWHNLHGGAGLVHQSSTAQLAWAARLLNVPCIPVLHPELFAAVAHLGMVTGAVCFDAFAHHDARRAFAFAATCAEEAGEWHLRGKIYSWRARQAVWLDRPDNALTYAEVGAVRVERLTPTERAMLSTARARAHAKTGDAQATLTAVGEADDAFSHTHPADDPPWMAYYDHAQHQGDTGHALVDLAMATRDPQHVKVAGERLAVATSLHADSYVRSRVFSRTKLATLTMATGDPYEAVQIGTTALEEAARVRSGRADAGLVELARTVKHERATVAVAAELRERIARTIGKGTM